MFRNYLAAALRNLVRNRLYAAINVVGLAVGFAAAIFAALFVRYELTYNRWIPGYERTYTIITTLSTVRGAPPEEWTYAYRDTARWMKLDFPEVEAAGRARGEPAMIVRRGDIREVENYGVIATADPGFFATLPFPAIAGDLDNALDRPDAIVLTRAMARKYFGRDAPIGETLYLDEHPMRVAAVIEDFPPNTTFPAGGDGGPKAYYSALAPFSSLRKWDAMAFTPEVEPNAMIYGGTFVRLKEGASLEALQGALPAFVKRHISPELLGNVQMRLMPISELHAPPIRNERYAALRARFIATIAGIAGIGALIVLAASINFINAVTARAGRRAVEVGIRKTTGALRRQLILQFIGESLGYALLALVGGLAMVAVTLPSAQGFLDRSFTVGVARDPPLLIGSGIATILIGILAGAYPAFVLSSGSPAVVLKARVYAYEGSGHLRRLLVTVQFAILICVAVVTVVTYRQTDFAINENLGFARNGTLAIEGACREAMLLEVRKLPGVAGAACGDIRGVAIYEAMPVSPTGQSEEAMAFTGMDAELLSVLDFKPVAGRFFDAARSEDIASSDEATNPNVVINEAAARRLGFSSPELAVGQVIVWRRKGDTIAAINTKPLLPSHIIGVAPDFSLNIVDPVVPKIFYAARLERMSLFSGGAYPLTVKLTGTDVPHTLAAIDELWNRLIDRNRPVQRQFISEILENTYRDVTRQAHLVAALAGVALLIAGLGLFSLATFTAERRTKEIGVRKALGASGRQILRLLLWEFIRPVLWANALAWPIAYLFVHHWLAGFAYHIQLEPWMFLSASLLATVIAIVTVGGHAILVSRNQPATALRYE